MRPCLFAILIGIATCTADARAQSALIGFQSPSHNIHCQFETGDTQNVVRCDVMEGAVTAPRPRDCDLEWGRAFEISNRRGRPGERICYGDTVMDPKLPVLAYGATWQHSGFICTSEQTGVTCFNADRHGFSLSRAQQTMF